jgi:hypothetical protein
VGASSGQRYGVRACGAYERDALLAMLEGNPPTK